MRTTTTSIVIAALLVVPACDSAKKDADKAAATKPETPAEPDDSAKDAEPEQPEEPADPWQKKLDARVLAQSGLDVGSKFSAFDIVNCESGEKYCQVCRYGSNPKIMAVGTVDDEAFHKDLQDLDAIVKKYGEDKIKAFAVIADLQSDKVAMPEDPKALQADVAKLRKKLRLSIPVVIPAAGEDGGNKVWEQYYNITKSRTVMFADGHNEVKYSAVAPEDFSKLDEAIRTVTGDKTG